MVEKEELIDEYAVAAFKYKDAGIPMSVWRKHFTEFAEKLSAMPNSESAVALNAPTERMLIAGSLVDWVKYSDKKDAARDVFNVMYRNSDISYIAAQVQAVARPLKEWHEDQGFVTWWKFPVDEPSYIGSPLCDDWPGYHTHWTPHPAIPYNPKK